MNPLLNSKRMFFHVARAFSLLSRDSSRLLFPCRFERLLEFSHGLLTRSVQYWTYREALAACRVLWRSGSGSPGLWPGITGKMSADGYFRS